MANVSRAMIHSRSSKTARLQSRRSLVVLLLVAILLLVGGVVPSVEAESVTKVGAPGVLSCFDNIYLYFVHISCVFFSSFYIILRVVFPSCLERSRGDSFIFTGL